MLEGYKNGVVLLNFDKNEIQNIAFRDLQLSGYSFVSNKFKHFPKRIEMNSQSVN